MIIIDFHFLTILFERVRDSYFEVVEKRYDWWPDLTLTVVWLSDAADYAMRLNMRCAIVVSSKFSDVSQNSCNLKPNCKRMQVMIWIIIRLLEGDKVMMIIRLVEGNEVMMIMMNRLVKGNWIPSFSFTNYVIWLSGDWIIIP